MSKTDIRRTAEQAAHAAGHTATQAAHTATEAAAQLGQVSRNRTPVLAAIAGLALVLVVVARLRARS